MIVHGLEVQILELAHTLPLSWFAFVASFIEEVIVPIPSPLVMLTAGSFARIQGISVHEIITLALIASVGKTCGATCIYWLSDKAEDIVFGRYANFFGVNHSDVEKLGKRFSGTPRDYVLMILLRALPIVPSAIMSIGSGVLKLPLRLFVLGTFMGTIVRDGIYLYVGYVGTKTLRHFIATSAHIEDVLFMGSVVVVVLILAFFYTHKKRNAAQSTSSEMD